MLLAMGATHVNFAYHVQQSNVMLALALVSTLSAQRLTIATTIPANTLTLCYEMYGCTNY